MRKMQQKKILDMVKTLEENHNRLRGNPQQVSVADLLAECQNTAVEIGEYIESIEGEGTKTVTLLEEYCDLAYLAYEDRTGANHAKKLQAQAIKIGNSVRSELKPNKIEVVFFPYQLSMFDAFHSVYLAAKEDPNCDAYVVPVPWYDKIPGGALGKMHYDGDKYPESIPITDWREYDIEARHPDVIFIHASFDTSSAVTSLHPDYYSQRLRELTDLLCYIPYAVSYDDDGAPNHIKTEACQYSHKVFLQSERVRDNYMRIFTDKYGLKHGKPKDKFIALGSPKFDAVINARREDFELPKDWLKLIEGKKAILYNTTIGSALTNAEQYLKKIKSVLDTFRKRDDVVLWWRPHPLLEETYRSMRPDLLREYQFIVMEYRGAGWGIYDDTPDLHRAIAWSDAYYGDWSSLVPMYQCLEKPILIQNVRAYSDNIVFESFCTAEDYIWFTARTFNALFRMDRNTWKPEYVGSFPSGQGVAPRLYGTVLRICNRLCFSPMSADNIAFYDIDSGEFTTIPVPKPGKSGYLYSKTSGSSKFIKAYRIDKRIYFIPNTYPGILVYNEADGEVCIIDDWVSTIDGLVFDMELGYFRGCAFDVERNCLILTCLCANAVVELDVSTNKTKVCVYGNEKTGYFDIQIINGAYWLLLSHKAAILQYDPANNDRNEYRIALEHAFSDEYYQYQQIVEVNGSLYIIPSQADRIIRFDLEGKSFSPVEKFCPQDPGRDESAWAFPHNFLYSFNDFSGDKIFLHTGKTNMFIEFDLLTGYMREEEIKAIGAADYNKLWEHIIKDILMYLENKSPLSANQYVLSEDCYFNLENMLDIMKTPELPTWLREILAKQRVFMLGETANSNQQAGLQIYGYCKNIALSS